MKSQKQKEQQSAYNRDALIFRILEEHKKELQEMSNKELVNAWKFSVIVKEENIDDASIQLGSLLDIGLEQGTKEPPDAYDESIKVFAVDLITRARKAGHTITPKLQPETD